MAAVMTNFNDALLLTLENVAKAKGMSVSELIQEKMIEWIEDEEDLRDAETESAEYSKNPKAFRNFKELEEKWLA